LEGGPPRFPPDSTCPTLLGSGNPEEPPLSPTGLSPSPVALSSDFAGCSAREAFVTSWEVRSPPRCRPTTPHGQRLRAFAPVRFGLFPVRSPLLGESRLISLPPATEMFHFAGFASRAYLGFRPWIPCLDGTVGFPIRESPDHSPLSGSPGLIAAGHALHRLRLPRDPFGALSSLKATASFTKFSKSKIYLIYKYSQIFGKVKKN
jgi:hypothetical protein